MKFPFRAWPWLAVSAGSALLLVLLVIGLLLQGRGAPGAPALTVEGVPGGSSFAPGFGRLDDLVPFSGGAAPVAEAVVPTEHAPEFRDSDWVKAQKPDAWTIQVMAAREEEAVKRFLAGREDRGDFAYFVFPQEGSTWYVVTLGSYPTRELADGIAASKGLEPGAGGTFPRRLSVYQEALQPAPAPEATPATGPDAAAPAPAPAPVPTTP